MVASLPVFLLRLPRQRIEGAMRLVWCLRSKIGLFSRRAFLIGRAAAAHSCVLSPRPTKSKLTFRPQNPFPSPFICSFLFTFSTIVSFSTHSLSLFHCSHFLPIVTHPSCYNVCYRVLERLKLHHQPPLFLLLSQAVHGSFVLLDTWLVDT